MQINPKEELTYLIRHYLIYYPSAESPFMRFFSDGSPGIIIPMGNSELPFSIKTNSRKGKIMLYGLMEHYVDVPRPSTQGMIVVVLQPYSVALLSELDPFKLKNRILFLSEILPGLTHALENKISQADGINEIIELVEDFFHALFFSKGRPEQVITDCIKIIKANSGNISMTKLLQELPLSERHLERKFNRWIGTSPKKFFGIVRFTEFLKLLRQNTKISAGAAALATGYYDQAHLNNHFKSLTGSTPSKYLEGKDPTAMNLFYPGRRI